MQALLLGVPVVTISYLRALVQAACVPAAPPTSLPSPTAFAPPPTESGRYGIIPRRAEVLRDVLVFLTFPARCIELLHLTPATVVQLGDISDEQYEEYLEQVARASGVPVPPITTSAAAFPHSTSSALGMLVVPDSAEDYKEARQDVRTKRLLAAGLYRVNEYDVLTTLARAEPINSVLNFVRVSQTQATGPEAAAAAAARASLTQAAQRLPTPAHAVDPDAFAVSVTKSSHQVSAGTVDRDSASVSLDPTAPKPPSATCSSHSSLMRPPAPGQHGKLSSRAAAAAAALAAASQRSATRGGGRSRGGNKGGVSQRQATLDFHQSSATASEALLPSQGGHEPPLDAASAHPPPSSQDGLRAFQPPPPPGGSAPLDSSTGSRIALFINSSTSASGTATTELGDSAAVAPMSTWGSTGGIAEAVAAAPPQSTEATHISAAPPASVLHRSTSSTTDVSTQVSRSQATQRRLPWAKTPQPAAKPKQPQAVPSQSASVFEQSTQLVDDSEGGGLPEPPSSGKRTAPAASSAVGAMVVPDTSSESGDSQGAPNGDSPPSTSAPASSRNPPPAPLFQIDLVLSSDDDDPEAAQRPKSKQLPVSKVAKSHKTQSHTPPAPPAAVQPPPAPPAEVPQTGTPQAAAASPARAPAKEAAAAPESPAGADGDEAVSNSSEDQAPSPPPEEASPPPDESSEHTEQLPVVQLPPGCWSSTLNRNTDAPHVPGTARGGGQVQEVLLSAEEAAERRRVAAAAASTSSAQEKGSKGGLVRGRSAVLHALRPGVMDDDDDAAAAGGVQVITVLDDLVEGGMLPYHPPPDSIASSEGRQQGRAFHAVRPPGTIGSGSHSLLPPLTSEQLQAAGGSATALTEYYSVEDRLDGPWNSRDTKVFRRFAGASAAGYYTATWQADSSSAAALQLSVPGNSHTPAVQYGIATADHDLILEDTSVRQIARELEQEQRESEAGFEDFEGKGRRTKSLKMSLSDALSQLQPSGAGGGAMVADSSNSQARWRDDLSAPVIAASAAGMTGLSARLSSSAGSKGEKRGRRGVSSSQRSISSLQPSQKHPRSTSRAGDGGLTQAVADGSGRGGNDTNEHAADTAGSAQPARRGVVGGGMKPPQSGGARRRRGVSSSGARATE